MKPLTIALALFSLAATPAAAHSVWLERDPAGVRVYLGEAAEPMPPGGDPEFPKLKAPLVFTGDARQAPASLTRMADHILARVEGGTDVRLQDGAVFEPWRTRAGDYEAAVFYARLGRAERRTLLDLEVAPDGDGRYVVTFKGRPLSNASVVVVDPEQWSKTFKADSEGRLELPAPKRGRYLLEVSHAESGDFQVGGQAVSKLHHVSTLTFEAP